MSRQRVKTSLPDYAFPYQLPLKPKPTTFNCMGKNTGSVYTTPNVVYGNCSGRPLPGAGGWDFVCPKGQMCYSQTTPLAGDTPQDICCGRTKSEFELQRHAELGELQPVQFWSSQYHHK